MNSLFDTLNPLPVPLFTVPVLARPSWSRTPKVEIPIQSVQLQFGRPSTGTFLPFLHQSKISILGSGMGWDGDGGGCGGPPSGLGLGRFQALGTTMTYDTTDLTLKKNQKIK